MKDAGIIVEYYNKGGEFTRLQQGTFKLEKLRTEVIISRFLKKKKLKVLDAGGGPGVYSFWLASLGHEVHLLDLSPRNIKEAARRDSNNKKKLASITAGNACSLPYDQDYFDIVLLLGPLYHLTEGRERLRALKEAKRVLKKGGVVLAAAISRHASLFAGFFCNQGLLKDPAFIKIMSIDVKNGQHRNNTNKDYHTTAYYHTVSGLEREIEQSGFNKAEVLPIEGFGCIMPEFEKMWKSRKYRKMIVDYANRLEREDSIKGMSAHIMGIGRKKD